MQGYVLVPVFFLIFIINMPLYINDAYAEIYADYTTAHTAHKDQNIVQVKHYLKVVQLISNFGAVYQKCLMISRLLIPLLGTSMTF